MRILGKCLLATLAASLLLGGYVYLATKSAPKVDRIRSFAALRAVYAIWVDRGRPVDFDPKEYVTSQAIQFARDTNTYAGTGGSVRALASARSQRFPARQHLIISEEGKLFWIDGDAKAKPVQNSVRER